MLLSVLVVCVIGVMVPSAFAETYSIYIDNKTFDTSGCYETESCLFPYVLYVEKGDSIQFVIDKYWRYTMVSGSLESGPYDPWVPSDGFSGGGVQMNEVGKFSYYDTAYPWLEGKVIVTEPGEYNIPEKYFPVKIKYDLIQKLEEDYDALFDLQRKASCYQMDKPAFRFSDDAISACTELLEELEKIDGWNDTQRLFNLAGGKDLKSTTFSLVFDPRIIESEDNVTEILGKSAYSTNFGGRGAEDLILRLIDSAARLVMIHNSIILKTMVTNAENTITSNPEITLDAQADLIYDLRKWKEVKGEKLKAGDIFSSLKTTYKQLWEKENWMTQEQLAEIEKEKIKEKIKQEIGGVVEPEPMIDEEPATSSPTCGEGTVLKNGVCVVEEKSEGGGCLIATATFGSEMAPQVQFLREIRDNTVLQTESGSAFMTGFNQFYYSFSPAIADYERENPAFKEVVKITLTPLLTSLTLLQYADIDSESEMLGYGIGVILLNIGMYFVAPAVLIMKVRKIR